MCIRDRYTPDEERRKQITALLFKYKQGLSYTELQTLMKDKCGINLVFHTGKGHTKPCLLYTSRCV